MQSHEETRPDRESVWDYPRPPAVEPVDRHVRAVFAGRVVADTRHPLKVMETSHPPVYYIPPGDVDRDVMVASDHHTFCEYKGQASYYHVRIGQREAPNAAWYYPDPSPGYEMLADHLAFYASLMDECTVDGEVVEPQPGHFYGGWITSEIVGPFKGGPKTAGW